jgi:hypothetical protein
MAEMKDFEDLEAHLSRYQPAGPPADLRDTVMARASQVLRGRGLGVRWYAAAAALLVALNLATERYICSRTAPETPWLPPTTSISEYRDVIASLNGLAGEWWKWEALLFVGPRAPALRAPGLRPTTPKDLFQEWER